MALIAISDVIKPDARDAFAYFEKQREYPSVVFCLVIIQ